MNHQHVFIKAIMAGLFIGIAGLIYLSVDNKVLGALLFSFGLLMVVSKGYYLYTGKVGYAVPYEKGYFIVLLKTLAGNIVGIVTVGLLFRFSGMDTVIEQANTILTSKLSNLWYETLILSIFCGMMMYVGVEGYRKMEIPLMKILIVIFAVVIFILAKFEHSIANMLYLAISTTFSAKGIFYVLLWIIGNAMGGIILNIAETKLSSKPAH
jgi:formate transporter